MLRRPEAATLPLLLVRVPLPAAFALVALLAPLVTLGQVVRERVSVEAVTVTVTARDGAGRPVRDLRAADLSLSVDGKPVAIDTFLAEPRAAAHEAVVPPAPPGAVESATQAPVPQPPRPIEIAIVVDEGSAYPFDRRDVYDELSKFLSVPFRGDRLFLVARYTLGGLVLECPWTADAQAARAAVSRLRAHPSLVTHPAANPLEIEMSRSRFLAAILEMFAAFSDTSTRREFLLVSDGLLLARPEDLNGSLSNSQRSSRDFSRQAREPSGGLAAGQERQAFELWSRAVSSRPSDSLTATDVIAKAVERDIVFIPIAAVAIDRGVNPGADTKSLVHSNPTDGILSAQIGPAQGMMRVAEDTGGEPVLLPKKTAARLAEIEDRESYALTFLNPAAGDHNSHRIAIACRRPGVRLEYRRGYRIATEEDRTLDRVVAAFRQPAREENPLGVTAFLSPALSKSGRNVTRVSLRYSPPRESAPAVDRNVELLAVGEDAQGNRTEPIRWSGTASRLDAAGTFEAALDLGVPAGSFTWSLGVRDQPTGLVSYLLTPSRP
jgi:VWFA-related protein